MRIFFNLESITFVPSLYYTSSIMMTIVWHVRRKNRNSFCKPFSLVRRPVDK